MKKLILFLLLLPTITLAQLELPYSVKVLNPKPVDAWYFESDGTPYDNTAEVLAQVTAGVRYRGMTFNVNGVEYWFGAGTADLDLTVKSTAFTLANGSGTTANGSGVDLGGTLTGSASVNMNGNSFNFTNGAANILNITTGTSSFWAGANSRIALVGSNGNIQNWTATGSTWSVIHNSTARITVDGTGQIIFNTGTTHLGGLFIRGASDQLTTIQSPASGNALISSSLNTAPTWGKIGLTTHVSGILPVANGGTGTSTPSLVAGTNVSISGTWPNQTIDATGGFSNPMTTTGDLILGGASGTATRLGIGSNNQVLTSNGTTASWQTPASGFADPMTTRGDLIYRNASNVTARLPIGASGTFLSSDGTDASWSKAYTTIQQNETSLTKRNTLNFTGLGIVAQDNAGSDRTDVTLNSELQALSQVSGNGFMVWSGSGLTIREILGTTDKITVTNGDGIANDPVINIGSDVVDKTLANTYTAGAKQTVLHDATNSGLRIAEAVGNPSSLGNGDIWLNSTDDDLYVRINGTTTGLTRSVIEDVATTTYTFTEADRNKIKRFTHASGCTADVPAGLSLNWSATAYRASGAGVVTFTSTGGGGGTIEGAGTTMDAEKTMAYVHHRGSNIYVVAGAVGSSSGVATLDDVGDVTITSNTSGEILKWNGSAWVNNTLAEAGIQPAGSYLTANQTITLNGDVTGSGTTAITTTIADASIEMNDINATGTPSATTFLRGDGQWVAPSGSGDVTKVGTPVANQVGVWTGNGTIEGTSSLTFNSATTGLVSTNANTSAFRAVVTGSSTGLSIDASGGTGNMIIGTAPDGGSFFLTNTGLFDIRPRTAATNSLLTNSYRVQSTGTAATGLGIRNLFTIQNTTGTYPDVASEEFSWGTVDTNGKYLLKLRTSSTLQNVFGAENGKLFAYQAPANDDALTQVLVRDGTTGEIKYRDSSTLGGGSGMTYAQVKALKYK
jgi:hypothetical protein